MLERVEERLPVLIGRDASVASVVLAANMKVSRLHASLELRGDDIFVRDAGSANGTLVDGRKIAPGSWVNLGRGDVPRELSISDWTVQVTCVRAPAPGTADTTSFGDGSNVRPLGLNETLASADPSDPGRGDHTDFGAPSFEGDPFEEAYASYVQASGDLHERLVRDIEAHAPAERSRVAAARARQFPLLGNDTTLTELLLHYGATIPSAPTRGPASAASASRPAPPGRPTSNTYTALHHPAPPTPTPHARTVVKAELVALRAIEHLSRWYVDRPATTPEEIAAFTDKLRDTLDELLRGHVPLLAGLDRFERRLALHAGDEVVELPRTPAAVARALLDWRDTSARPVQALRRTFGDLMLHQVGMLNGIMRGVSVLLAELSPRTLEKSWLQRNGRRGAFGRLRGRWNKEREMLAILAQRHSDLADEENETFRLLFGPEFVHEYRLLAEEQAASVLMPDAAPSSVFRD